MNILQIQDKLKDLSDQQLVSEMSSPSGSAPQFLVLSEMKRRKEMRARASTPQAPQGTMAEEAVQDGIAALAQQPSSYEMDDQAAVEEMAAGGIVRLFGGGSTDPRAIQRNLENQVLEAELADIVRRQSSQTDRAPLISNAMRDVRALIDSGMSDEAALQETLRSTSFRGRVSREDLAPAFNARRSTAPAGGQSFTEETPIAPAPIPGSFPDGPISESDPVRGADPFAAAPAFLDGPNIGSPSATPIPRGASRPTGTQGSASSPAASATGTAGASGTAAAGGASAAAGGIGSLPQSRGFSAILDEIERRGSGSRLDELARQMERTDPAARRSEATNIALLEAGLRIAGSNNPNAIGALSEGAAALPGYARQLSEIRKDQRDDILTQVQMERARAEDSRSARALAANLYGTESQRDLAIMRERGDASRHAASMGYNERRLAAEAARHSDNLEYNNRRLTAEVDDRNQRRTTETGRLDLDREIRRDALVPPAMRLWQAVNPGVQFDRSNPQHMSDLQLFVDRGAGDRAQANLNETRARNIETALNNWRQNNSDFIPNLPQDRIQAMRPAARDRYLAQQAEYVRIQRGEGMGGGGAPITPDNPLGIRR